MSPRIRRAQKKPPAREPAREPEKQAKKTLQDHCRDLTRQRGEEVRARREAEGRERTEVMEDELYRLLYGPSEKKAS